MTLNDYSQLAITECAVPQSKAKKASTIVSLLGALNPSTKRAAMQDVRTSLALEGWAGWLAWLAIRALASRLIDWWFRERLFADDPVPVSPSQHIATKRKRKRD